MKIHSIIAIVVSGVLLFSCNNKKNETEASAANYVRKNAHSAAAAADLAAYEKALDTMRKMDCNNPLSWYYQGAIHNLPDYDTYLKAKGDLLCPAFKGGQMWTGWATCPHMKPGLEQYHFLTWHRLYLYYLEKIVRKLSGKADFALPYWNYNNPAQRTMPSAFYAPADSINNALYDIERSPFLLAGNAIDSTSTDAIVMTVQVMGKDTIVVVEPAVEMSAILDTGYLWTASDLHHFSYEMEDVVHNCMHDYIGAAVNPSDIAQLPNIYNRIYQTDSKSAGGALMGDVPSSAFDPIFFLHHANLDRLWAAWEKDHPDLALTFEEFEKAGFAVNYTFFDENGKEIHYTSLQQVYDSIRAIDYVYDYMAGQPALKEAKHLVSNLKTQLGSVSPKATIESNAKVFTVDLSEALSANKTDKTFYSLEIETSFPAPPETRMSVILIGTTPDKTAKVRDYLVGWVGFFGASHSKGSHGGGMHGHMDTGGSKLIKLDITDELNGQNALDKKQLKVVLQADHPDPKAPVTINKITIKSYQKS